MQKIHLTSLFSVSLVEYMKLISDNAVGSKIIQAFAIILAIFSGLIANFYYCMLNIILIFMLNSIKSKDYDITNIYFLKGH